MARIRTLKPEIWMSPQVMNLSVHSRLLFIGLITQADDAGRGTADARRLKAAIFGGDDCTSADVRRWLDEVSAQGLAVIYESPSHGILYQLPSWKQHQSIDRPRNSAYPPPDQPPEPPTPRGSVAERSPMPREGSEGKGREGRGMEGNVARAPEPDPDNVIQIRWAEIRNAYPEAASSNWLSAEKAARIRVAEGDATWDELLAVVRRYAAYCLATARLVMDPANFFARSDKPWQQPWELPKTKAQLTQDANVDAGLAWLQQQETVDAAR
jgi:hypothetical protein